MKIIRFLIITLTAIIVTAASIHVYLLNSEYFWVVIATTIGCIFGNVIWPKIKYLFIGKPAKFAIYQDIIMQIEIDIGLNIINGDDDIRLKLSKANDYLREVSYKYAVKELNNDT